MDIVALVGDISMIDAFFIWITIAFLFAFVEFSYPGLFFFLSFSCGAVVTGCTIFLGVSVYTQVYLFLVSSLICFMLLYFVHNKYITEKSAYRTNVCALRGKRGITIKTIMPFMSGLVIVQGQIWSAYSYDDSDIEEKSFIEVVDIRGVHLMVKKVKDSL